MVSQSHSPSRIECVTDSLSNTSFFIDSKFQIPGLWDIQVEAMFLRILTEISHLGQVGALGDPERSRSDADEGRSGHLQDG